MNLFINERTNKDSEVEEYITKWGDKFERKYNTPLTKAHVCQILRLQRDQHNDFSLYDVDVLVASDKALDIKNKREAIWYFIVQ